MPITMYNKKTGHNVKVYGFVHTGSFENKCYAVTYRPTFVEAFKKAADDNYMISPESLEFELVLASDLRPLDV